MIECQESEPTASARKAMEAALEGAFQATVNASDGSTWSERDKSFVRSLPAIIEDFVNNKIADALDAISDAIEFKTGVRP